MNFFGFIWVISYVSSLFAPQTSFKLTDSLAKAFAVKPLALINNTVSRSNKTERFRVAAVASGSRMTQAHSPSVRLYPNPGYYRSIPPLQSFRRSLGWLNLPEHALPGADLGGRSPAPYAFQTVLPSSTVSTLISSEDGEEPRGVMRLLSHLSRWQKGVIDHTLTASTVNVVRAGQKKGEDGVKQPQEAQRWQCNLQQTSARSKKAKEAGFQVWVKGKAIAELPNRTSAESLAQRIKQTIQEPDFDPHDLHPTVIDDSPAGKAGKTTLFVVDEQIAESLGQNSDLIAIDWVNKLREALDVPTLSLTDAQTKLYGLSATGEKMEGIASWYGPYFHGRLTAAGEIFDQNKLTAAHPTLPFDTYLKVTNVESGNSVIVRVNDRGPYVENRTLDLSREAAQCLDSEISGVVPYEAEIMELAPATSEPSDRPNQSDEDAPQLADRRIMKQL